MKPVVLAIFLVLSAISITRAKTNAVVEEFATRLEVRSESSMTVTTYFKATILEEAGYRTAVFITYYDTFRKLKGLKYTITDASGKKVRKLGRADARDIKFNASYEVADGRIVYLDPEFRNFPFTVEIESEIEYSGFLDFPTWMPRTAPNIEVKKATLHFSCPEKFAFRFRVEGNVGTAKESIIDNVKLISWTLENLPAAGKQMSRKAFEAEQAKVMIAPIVFSIDKREGSFATWKDFGDWFQTLNEGRNALTPATADFLNALKKENMDVPGMVREVYSYMQSKTRYISIQLGIGGYQTIPSDVVEATGYGDCKALSNYMKAMFDYLEIPSNYILVNAGEDAEDVLADFPSNQFNHLFLGVPHKKDTLFLECTSQISPAFYIGTFTDDRNVLWVQKGNSRIIRTPAYAVEENRKINKATVVIDSSGNASVKLSIRQTGAYFNDFMYFKSGSGDRIEKFNYKKFEYKDFNIESFSYNIPAASKPTLDVNYTLKVKGMSQFAADKMILPSNVLVPVDHEMELDVPNKKAEIRRGFTIEDFVDLEVPAKFWIDFVPNETKLTSDFGLVEIKVTQNEENKIRIHRKAVFRKGLYTGEEFSKFNNFVRQARVGEQGKIVLRSKT